MAVSTVAGGIAAIFIGILCALAEGCHNTSSGGGGDCCGYIFGCIGVVLGGLFFLAITSCLWAILAFYSVQTTNVIYSLAAIDNAVNNGGWLNDCVDIDT